MTKCIFWFRKDLRLKDNIGLFNALNDNTEVIPIYIIDPTLINSSDTGSAKVKFILDSLKELSEKLTQAKSKLIIRFGKSDEQIIKLSNELNIKKLYFNKIYDLESDYNDEKTTPLLENFGLDIHSFKDNIFFDKEELFNLDFNEYKKLWKLKFKKLALFQTQEIFYDKFIKKNNDILSLAVPSLEDYDIEFNHNYPLGGENQGLKILKNNNYKYFEYFDTINPYYEFGNISIRQIINHIQQDKNLSNDILEELIKYNYFMFYRPSFKALNNSTNNIDRDYNKFLTFCRAETGSPIIDSCIKQINTEFNINTKIFPYVLNYLINDLGVDPLWIERYLSHKIINTNKSFFYMLMSNYSDKISYKKEYVNEYIKHYLPILKKIPDKYLHNPERMPLSLQKVVKCVIGSDYPKPIFNNSFYQDLELNL
jgi:deoxyribodipyrimidine photo-lyase